ncbi:MAG TPA: hypothetical protein VEQ65_04390, partial [Opitutus sp.]|nr:hypothetical protein [Opitutus sp.]
TQKRPGAGGPRDTAQPSLSSGFAAVMDEERALHAATEAYLGSQGTSSSVFRSGILREHLTQLAANIALLRQRYEGSAISGRAPSTPAETSLLAAGDPRCSPLLALLAGHRSLLGSVAALKTERADGQRGELILAEVARRHEEMAGALDALVRSGDAHPANAASGENVATV